MSHASNGLADDEGRLALLKEADQHLQNVLERNPLDHRARRIQGDIKREMASLDPALWAEAMAATKTLEALQPAYWGPLVQQAKLYIAVEDYKAAILARDRAAALRQTGVSAKQLDNELFDLDNVLRPFR